MNELVFEVSEDAEQGYSAECLSENIFTQAETREELRHNGLEAVQAFYFDASKTPSIKLHFVRNEFLLAS